MSRQHSQRGGMSSLSAVLRSGDSGGGDSNGSGYLHPPSQPVNNGLYRTFTPTNAGWSLNDYAWDKQANRVASREEIAAAGLERQQRELSAQPHSRTSSGYPYETSSPYKAHPGPMMSPIANQGKKHGAVEKGKLYDQSVTIVSPTPTRVDPHKQSSLESLIVQGTTQPGVKNKKPLSAKKIKQKGELSARKGAKSPALNAVGESVPFSRKCAAVGCDQMCHPSSKKRVERILCVYHGDQQDVDVNGVQQRFCQVCYALHPCDAFKGMNRTCNAVLARKRMLRIQRQKRVGKIGKPSGGDLGEDSDNDLAKGETTDGTTETGDDDAVEKKPVVKQTKKQTRGKKRAAKGKAAATQQAPSPSTEAEFHPPHGTVVGAPNQATNSGWFRSSNLFGLSGATQPTPKRARSALETDEERNQMVLDMEHGALGSHKISSVAIKVPHATPAFLSTAAGGMARAPPNEHLAANQTHGGLPLKKDEDALGQKPSPASAMVPHANPNVPNYLEHEMNSLLQWMDQSPPDGVRNSRGGGRMEDFGVDPFIRPGSLIYGVHAQGFVAAPEDNDEDTPVSARTRRHSAQSMLHTLASGDNNAGRLLRNATAALREKEEWKLGDGGAVGGAGDVAEGVFGSFNGEICRLDVCTDSGETITTVVKGLPVGFTQGTLAASQSCLDTSKETGTFVLPIAHLSPDLTVVCMFQGAHLPLHVETRKDGTTEITVSFMPQGGYHVAAEWTLNSVSETQEQGESGSPEKTHNLRDLEGTATLETVIADGPMRGLPVGHPLPLFLTPDHDLRMEVMSAMWRLEQEIAQKELLENAGDETCDENTGVLPEPLALISMLGSVLHAERCGHDPHPRMHRGAVAMAKYFNLQIVAARLQVDLNTNKQISPADVSDFFSKSVSKILKSGTVMLFSAAVLSLFVTLCLGTDYVSENSPVFGKHSVGTAAGVATVVLSTVILASVMSSVNRVSNSF